MEAILAATRNNTVTLRNGAEVGTLEPGKLADLLIVDGDPLRDVGVLGDRRRLAMIVKGGTVVDTGRPWPERTVWPYERTLMLSGRITPDAVAARRGGRA
jgi:cytosine/adenosine deaminase-related metal-dependent hydrolase